ncbi:MAG: acyl transferase, partial [Bacteroidota bacterium]
MQTTNRNEILSGLANLRAESFETSALALFQYQAQHNAAYRQFLNLLARNPLDVKQLDQIPFLPIRFFKSHLIQTGAWTPETVFTSSSTTGQIPSQHLVRDLSFYLENTRRGFAQFYGDPADYCWLALLPSYLERSGSSLVAMADHFIRLSQYPESGFFLHDFEALAARIRVCQARAIPTVLLGVSFALLDFAEQYPIDLQGITIMETGGMKG